MGLINIVEERKETRDLSFNIWHRTQTGLSGVDIDFVETCTKCQKPLCLIELVRDNGNNRVDIYNKCSLVTDFFALYTHRPSFVVFYVPNETSDSILSVKVKQKRPMDGNVVEMSADEFASYLRYLHRDHEVICKKQRKEVRAKNEIARGKRMEFKLELEEGIVPDTYDDEEVLLWSGQVADELMASAFEPQTEWGEDWYDATRNKVVEAMEPVMKKWNRPGGGASVPLPVELVVEMNKAGWAVVRSNLAR